MSILAEGAPDADLVLSFLPCLVLCSAMLVVDVRQVLADMVLGVEIGRQRCGGSDRRSCR